MSVPAVAQMKFFAIVSILVKPVCFNSFNFVFFLLWLLQNFPLNLIFSYNFSVWFVNTDAVVSKAALFIVHSFCPLLPFFLRMSPNFASTNFAFLIVKPHCDCVCYTFLQHCDFYNLFQLKFNFKLMTFKRFPHIALALALIGSCVNLLFSVNNCFYFLSSICIRPTKILTAR